MADHSSHSIRERLRLPWRISLTVRILVVNVIALALLAGSLFYIDSYRRELLAERYRLASAEAEITAEALAERMPESRDELVERIGASQHVRLQVYDVQGQLVLDSFNLSGPSFRLIDPHTEPFLQKAARVIDRVMDFMLGSPPIPDYVVGNSGGKASNWPEIAEALSGRTTVVRHRAAPDRTPMIMAATPIGSSGEALLITRNARDITQYVRDARQTLAIIVGGALLLSVLLSLFLARTIVDPLRKLVRAAVRVRLGRDRNVVVPRLPDRGDEIGLLARAISDMTAALRHRIDAVESFAADVSHELKNPLTSLRSALESLERVSDQELRHRLLGIAKDDVKRIDFLITEIADASRIDAQLSRTTFEPVDMARLIDALVTEREQRGVDVDCPIVVSSLSDQDMVVAGDAPRLERVIQNLLDNAVSFSPNGSSVEVTLDRAGHRVIVEVSDHGPGIPAEARERIFERFHSLRPSSEEFGRHSGLGLAIARTIVEAHFGKLSAVERRDGSKGARFVLSMPAWFEQ